MSTLPAYHRPMLVNWRPENGNGPVEILLTHPSFDPRSGLLTAQFRRSFTERGAEIITLRIGPDQIDGIQAWSGTYDQAESINATAAAPELTPAPAAPRTPPRRRARSAATPPASPPAPAAASEPGSGIRIAWPENQPAQPSGVLGRPELNRRYQVTFPNGTQATGTVTQYLNERYVLLDRDDISGIAPMGVIDAELEWQAL